MFKCIPTLQKYNLFIALQEMSQMQPQLSEVWLAHFLARRGAVCFCLWQPWIHFGQSAVLSCDTFLLHSRCWCQCGRLEFLVLWMLANGVSVNVVLYTVVMTGATEMENQLSRSPLKVESVLLLKLCIGLDWKYTSHISIQGELFFFFCFWQL